MLWPTTTAICEASFIVTPNAPLTDCDESWNGGIRGATSSRCGSVKPALAKPQNDPQDCHFHGHCVL